MQQMSGKTVVVTGATAGIGLATATEIAGRGAFVIGIGRSPERCRQAEEAIRAVHPGAKVAFHIADLSSLSQVRDLASGIRERVNHRGDEALHALVNNAGTVTHQYTESADGFELQFAVNHLAPFLLTHELMPLLKKAGQARVITVSSASHRWMRMFWGDLQLRRNYNCLLAYKQAKLANVLFTNELNRRLGPEASVRAYAADPGLVNTDIGLKGTAGVVRYFWSLRRRGGVTPARGAATSIFLACEPAAWQSPHSYWKDCRPLRSSPYSRRADVAGRLWDLSEILCGVEPGTYGLKV